MIEQCPIMWRGKDGSYPCAFYQKYNHMCTKHPVSAWDAPCIPQHKERYYHSLEEVVVLCRQCQNEVQTTRGNAERGIYPLCPECSKRHSEFIALSEHVFGRC